MDAILIGDVVESITDPAPSEDRGATSRCRGIVVEHHWEKRSLWVGVRWESGIVSYDAPGTLKVIAHPLAPKGLRG